MPHDEYFDPIKQLGEIQKALEHFDEARDYIVRRLKFYKGWGEENELASQIQYKKLLDAEKAVDL